MLSETTLTAESGSNLFAGLEPVGPDPLLALIALANADKRPNKIDVGVGVYRDAQGGTPIPRSVKAAEKILWEMQDTKSYLGSAGDKLYAELLRPIIFGPLASDERIAGLQTPGGCGALRLGFQLVAKAKPGARVLVGNPTWPNHPPVAKACGLEIVNYSYYDKASTSILFDQMVDALKSARSGDVVLLHGCCHNPTGADLDSDQWAEVTRIVAERGLLPFVDFAYQGLGDGLEEDAAGMRQVVEAADEALIAHSCDKSFGVYRDRVGSLFVKTGSKQATDTAFAHLMQQTREAWSMPPDHGGAVVRIVLEDPALRADWLVELDAMRGRIRHLRDQLAAIDPRLAYIARQHGMFSMLPITPAQVAQLRETHAIYMADSGRFNICGLADHEVAGFGEAVLSVMG